MNSTPILLLGFNRPNALRRRLDLIEHLPSRYVRIALDGSRENADIVKTGEVQKVAEKWASLSRHNVELIIQESNLGIQKHLPFALENSIKQHDKLIIIEDDIDFSPLFIEFVETNIDKWPDIFALQGYNPLFSNTLPSQVSMGLAVTKIPTIWGWAARADSIEYYLNFIRTHRDIHSLDKIIKQFSKSITRDIFLQNAIRFTWIKKMDRLLSGQGGSWDNWWVLACWASEKYLLMPEISLSREEMDQSEGQTHFHLNEGLVNLPFDNMKLESKISNKISKRHAEIRLLKVWGISRKYAWVFVFRLIRRRRIIVANAS